MHMQFRRKETSITGDDGRIGSTKEAAVDWQESARQ
ncbi:hypothetical protein OOU_Y34scaffold00194g5 [Pyricularia oryzae Y34]|uniref:Uncharacterized protein n=3 Tax=Pyricularia oryzae TaxID=318829 RepID=A0A4P7N6E5_PYROR|nr:hypothetical protein OOU_Y34scaffold00194g5 [Pyricularia oryzae Y34]QBZ55614.1 hypothetical protein PoMZ_00515 [Pyricularia oryzae]